MTSESSALGVLSETLRTLNPAVAEGAHHSEVAAFIGEEAHRHFLAACLGELKVTVSSRASVSAAYRMAAWISSLVSLG